MRHFPIDPHASAFRSSRVANHVKSHQPRTAAPRRFLSRRGLLAGPSRGQERQQVFRPNAARGTRRGWWPVRNGQWSKSGIAPRVVSYGLQLARGGPRPSWHEAAGIEILRTRRDIWPKGSSPRRAEGVPVRSSGDCYDCTDSTAFFAQSLASLTAPSARPSFSSRTPSLSSRAEPFDSSTQVTQHVRRGRGAR